MNPIFSNIPDVVTSWWEATKDLGRIRSMLIDLKKMGLAIPPQVSNDHQNAFLRVQALHQAKAHEAAERWCKQNKVATMIPFLGAERVHPDDERLLKRGADRAFHGYNGKNKSGT